MEYGRSEEDLLVNNVIILKNLGAIRTGCRAADKLERGWQIENPGHPPVFERQLPDLVQRWSSTSVAYKPHFPQPT